jgi:hypothetical protein
LLRQPALKDGEYHDQAVWTILGSEWTTRQPLTTVIH